MFTASSDIRCMSYQKLICVPRDGIMLKIFIGMGSYPWQKLKPHAESAIHSLWSAIRTQCCCGTNWCYTTTTQRLRTRALPL